MDICVDCKKIKKSSSSLIWHQLFCSASPREPATNPVTGEPCFTSVNDLGQKYFTDEPFEHCRSKNTDGVCEDFEPINLPPPSPRKSRQYGSIQVTDV